MLLALLLATTAMCLCTENSFAAELTQESAVPGVLSDSADATTIPTISDDTIPANEIEYKDIQAVNPSVSLTTDVTALPETTDEALEPAVDPALLQAYELQVAQLLAYQESLLQSEETISTENTANTANADKSAKKSRNSKKSNEKSVKEENEITLPESDELLKLSKKMEAQAKYSTDDVMLVAKLISHEAKGQSSKGMAAVAEVVINRINTPLYPDTVHDVIYQRGQFSHISGLKKENPTTEMIIIADLVLNYDYRVFNDPSVLYFRNSKKTNGFSSNVRKDWGKFEYTTCIDDHAFYSDKTVATAKDIPVDIEHNMVMAVKNNFS